MLEYLSSSNAIRIGDSFCGVFPQGVFIIDGQEVSIEAQYPLQFKDLDSLKIRKAVPPQLLHYIDEDGEIIPASEGEDAKNEERTYGGIYPDIATEIRVRENLKRFSNYKRVTSEPGYEFVPYKMKVLGTAEDTGSEFIESAIQSGSLNFGGSGVYKVHIRRIVADVVSQYEHLDVSVGGKYNMSKWKEKSPSVVDPRGLQVGEQPLFNRDEAEKFDFAFAQFRYEFELAKAQELEQKVRQVFNDAFFRIENQTALDDPIAVLDVYNRVSNAIWYVRKIEAKRNSEVEKNFAIKELEDIKKQLQPLVDDQNRPV